MQAKYSLSLVIAVFLLFCMGILMVFNTTAAEVLDRALERSTHHVFFKQMAYALIATVSAIGVYFLGYENVLRLSGIFLLLGTVFLILVFVPGIGMQINGANRWVKILGNSIQPSEFVKILLPLYTIHVIGRYKDEMTLKRFIRLALTLLIPIALILVEPDNGTVAIILVSLFVLFILMRIRWIYWALPLCTCMVVGGIAASQMSHVPDRIRVYLNPELDLKGKGHQPHQARIAAGSGGLFGKGIGESLQKMDYLPEARSDYIAAIFAEEFGFIGMIGLIMLYMTIGGIGFTMATKAPTLEGFYLVAILTFLICFQAFLNLGVVSGLLPSKGTNLPFFSHGGSSLLVNFLSVGLILSVIQKKRVYVRRK
ncbi:MAG: putative lipid II flippase FtsW [Chlamydiae bacterium]|nr:putative lipid II flippase FtsW [Chlamydiota bacterium]